MKKLLSNKWYVTVFVAPGLILFLVMAVIPLFTTGYYGLFNYDGIGQKVFIGLKNYKKLPEHLDKDGKWKEVSEILVNIENSIEKEKVIDNQ